MHWGYKITLSFAVFFVIMMYLVIRSFQENVDLVSETYYREELEYQSQIDKIKNTNALDEKVSAKWTSAGIEIMYPSTFLAADLSGKINLYRPSLAAADKTFVVNATDENLQIIPKVGLLSGKYILKIDWEYSQKNYYQELTVFVP